MSKCKFEFIWKEREGGWCFHYCDFIIFPPSLQLINKLCFFFFFNCVCEKNKDESLKETPFCRSMNILHGI